MNDWRKPKVIRHINVNGFDLFKRLETCTRHIVAAFFFVARYGDSTVSVETVAGVRGAMRRDYS
jgi:hypothetical protein